MELKQYQADVLDMFSKWLDVLAEKHKLTEKMIAQIEGGLEAVPDLENYPRLAWTAMIKNGLVKDTPYVDRHDDSGRPIPHACFKVPTGGGKTLIAAAAMERLNRRTGLVLWVVPTKKIYDQTLRSLKTRGSPVRQRLDNASDNHVKIMEKSDAFNKHDLENYLCVMILSLAAANRNKNKDFLTMNRDSGGYQSFFPDRDNKTGNADMLKNHPSLEIEGGYIRHSLANVFRVNRPVVILDEAHKAYSRNQQELSGMINTLSPDLVLETSATPNPGISNLLVDVSGNDLWKEEMIKMPIELKVQNDFDWHGVLDNVYDHLVRLEQDAVSQQQTTGRHIRPIALVRVERTGKEQDDGRHIHANDARKYLMKKHAVPSSHIAIQSSEQNDLENVNLMLETEQIRWIITKDAIKEGWDCPFAYILAILDNIKAKTAVTQLLGRVLRQPSASRTGTGSLDKSYMYCNKTDTGKVAEYVKAGLTDIGMGDIGFAVNTGGPKTGPVMQRKTARFPNVRLPLVLHKDGDGWIELDYKRHILSGVKFDLISAPDPDMFRIIPPGWQTIIISPDGDADVSDTDLHHRKVANVSDMTRTLSDIVPNVWQAARIAQEFIDKIRGLGKDEADIYNGMPDLTKKLCGHVHKEVDKRAKRLFRRKVRRGAIRFDLEISGMQYQVRDYEVRGEKLFYVGGGSGVALRTLFDPMFEEEFETNLERSFAEYLDAKTTIDWWYRVAANQHDSYHLRGWKKDRIYPDFVVMRSNDGSKVRLGIYDTKGEHLVGNLDTTYKAEVLKTLEGAFDCGNVKINGNSLQGEFRLVLDGEFAKIMAD